MVANQDTHAQGDLLISPNRIVFEGRDNKAELNLINTGTEATTFSVSFVQRRMNADGSFESIDSPDPGQMFADPFLRVYPRRVTLQPGEAQVVMVQCMRKPNMPDGEYRSHLYFRSEKDYTPLGSTQEESSNSVTVRIIPIFGMSIPIIIRSGAVNVQTSISDLRLESEPDLSLKFTVNRTGNKSVYGDLKAEYIPKQGKPVELGTVKGVAVYTNLDKRYINLKLNLTPGLMLMNGKVKVSYTSRDDAIRHEIFAEAELEL